MESNDIHYHDFNRYLSRLRDNLELFQDDLIANRGDIDLHDYSFSLETLQQVMTGKVIITLPK